MNLHVYLLYMIIHLLYNVVIFLISELSQRMLRFCSKLARKEGTAWKKTNTRCLMFKLKQYYFVVDIMCKVV